MSKDTCKEKSKDTTVGGHDPTPWPDNHTIKKLLIQYIDVGQISPVRAEAFIDRWNDRPGWRSMIRQLQKQGIAVVTLPVRPGSQTRLELTPPLQNEFMEDCEGLDDVVMEETVIDEVRQEAEAMDAEVMEGIEDSTEGSRYDTWVSDLSNVPGVEIEVEEDD